MEVGTGVGFCHVQKFGIRYSLILDPVFIVKTTVSGNALNIFITGGPLRTRRHETTITPEVGVNEYETLPIDLE